MNGSLPPVAQLFGRLLLYELDSETTSELRKAETRGALAGLGIEVPESGTEEALAVEYFECFLHPDRGAPPIASLWIDGDYGGSCRRDIERWAADCGFDFTPRADLAVPSDHLGTLLLLWSELAEEAPDKANELAAQLGLWAPRALDRPAQHPGFYGQLSRAVVRFLSLVGDPEQSRSKGH